MNDTAAPALKEIFNHEKLRHIADQTKAVIEGGEEKRSALWSENLGRVPNERDYRCRNPASPGLSHRSTQYLLMAKVDTVEGSQGHRNRNIM